jgi:murein DD-endopeptidase MepM/ murein hydrolase activator NlpD
VGWGGFMKKVISLILSLVIISSVTIAAVTVKADELTDAQKKLDNIKDSISEKKDELDNINKEKDSAEKAIKEVEEKLKETSNSLNELNGKVSDLNEQIQGLEKQISEKDKSLKQQNEMLKKRLRSMYINGNESYLSLILGANSFSDLLNRVDSVIKVIEYDKKLVKTFEENKEALETQKTDVAKKKQETVGLKQEVEVKQKELALAADKKKEIMADIVKNKVAYEQMIKEEEEQSKAISTMINQIKKKKEEEKKRQEQQGTTSPNSSGSSSAIGKLYCVTGTPTYITSPYGWRVHPVLGYKRFHAGIDIGVFSGTKLYSLADGEVIYSGWMSGYGNVIMIDHGSLTSVYAHNSSLVGKVGQKVKGGQLIAYSGNTGLSSGPHLHFEIRKENGETIDPSPYYVR